MPRKRAKRANGNGSVYQNKQGIWVAALPVGYDVETGNLRRKTWTAPTQKEVQAKLDAGRHQRDSGMPVLLPRQTVEQWCERWLEKVRTSRKHGTHQVYSWAVHEHIVPTIGRMQINQVTSEHIKRVIDRAERRGLLSSTRNNLLMATRNAFEAAVSEEIIQRNVAKQVAAPRIEQAERRLLTPAEVNHFLTTARGHRIEALWHFYARRGLRLGEGIGLMWKDIDWERQVIYVCRSVHDRPSPTHVAETKTVGSNRTLPLADDMIELLHQHHTLQLELRLKMGGAWKEQGLIFPTMFGKPTSCRYVEAAFRRLLRDAGLPHVRLHDLRHGFATNMAEEGVPPRTIMDLLGHTNLRTTLRVYTRALESGKREATDQIDQAYRRGKKDAS
jgi:integrase